MINPIRLYNQNRKKIWITVIAIIFILIIIQLLNYFAKIKDEDDDAGKNQNVYTPSESIISDSNVPKTRSEDFNQTIQSFLDYCINQEPDKAYELLSDDCKEVLFPTLEYFKTSYYKTVFTGKQIYNFQSWSSDKDYVYKIRILENVLATGQYKDTEAVEDYFTIVKTDQGYRLNINGYVGRRQVNKQEEKDKIKLVFKSRDIFIEYEICNFEFANTTDKQVVMDTQVKTDTMYLTDNKNVNYIAMAHEIIPQQLKLMPNEKKQLSIKFNDAYGNSKRINKVTFSNIIPNYEEYMNVSDKENYQNIVKIEMKLKDET